MADVLHPQRNTAVEVSSQVLVCFESNDQLYLTRAGSVWSSPSVLSAGRSPSFVRSSTSIIWLFYIDDARAYYCTSLDGYTFSIPVQFTDGAIVLAALSLPGGGIGVVVSKSGGLYLYKEEDALGTGVLLSADSASDIAAAGYSDTEGDSAILAYITDGVVYVLEFWPVGVATAYGVASTVDVIYLPTGYLLLVVDRGWHLWGMMSTDLGQSFFREWEVQVFTNFEGSTYPTLFRSSDDDLYVFATVAEEQGSTDIQLQVDFINLFVYVSQIVALPTEDIPEELPRYWTPTDAPRYF